MTPSSGRPLPRRRPTRSRLGVLLLGFVLAAQGAGCGVPASSEVQVPDLEDVPYRLLQERSDSPTSDPTPVPGATSGEVAFITGEGRIQLVRRSVTAGSPPRTTQALLDQLSLGPSEHERERGLESSVPVEGNLKVLRVLAGTALISIPRDTLGPAADRLPLTVAQIVLTATSAPSVDSVLLERDGQRVDAPLPNGSLTTTPLRRNDFAAFLAEPNQ
jgi:hypothetical protein